MENLKSFSVVTGILNEGYAGQGSTNARPASEQIVDKNVIIKLDGSLFKLGKDQIDTKSQQFQSALNVLKGLGGSSVEITGGASAVGNDSGFDNQGLAKRRAENFVKALKDAGVNTTNYTIKAKVGKETVANSEKANQEQFVKISFPKIEQSLVMQPAIDATATTSGRKIVLPINKVLPIDRVQEYSYSVIKVVTKKGRNSDFIKMVQDLAQKNDARVTNITNDYLKLGGS